MALVPVVAAAATDWANATDSAAMIVVAMAEKSDPSLSAGATPRGYDALPAYSGSQRSIAAAEKLAVDYALVEIAAWNIEPLRLRCMVYRIDDHQQRAALLLRLRQDRRVQIAQPLNEFETLDQPPAALSIPAAAEQTASSYNDPYNRLQTGFATLHAAEAQRWSTGSGGRIALIDTAVDASHPDLAGRIIEQRDLVAADATPASLSAEEQRHGTEVAGVIAAVANNHIGIVGIAPSAQILSYRACWAQATTARCNSFTLALALSAAIESGARVINLSLGGPADPLLAQLLIRAIGDGAIVVGAVPPDGRMDGFPLNVSGVIAVTTSDDASGGSALRAPGRDVLTLQTGGHYGYASGSSLATAQTSAAIALLLQLRPRLDAATAHALLVESQGANGSINACHALASLLNDGSAACTDAYALASKVGGDATR